LLGEVAVVPAQVADAGEELLEQCVEFVQVVFHVVPHALENAPAGV
jgi:hypothetical protein